LGIFNIPLTRVAAPDVPKVVNVIGVPPCWNNVLSSVIAVIAEPDAVTVATGISADTNVDVFTAGVQAALVFRYT
jgi:hypothetical protein